MPTTKLQFLPLDERALAEENPLSYNRDTIVNDPKLASILGISKRTLEGWRRRRKIPFIQLSRKCVRYRLSEVLRCLEEKYTVREIHLRRAAK